MIPHALEELRFVQRADVWKAGRLAGTLERGARGEVVFRYRGGYDGPPIATTLPVGAPADEATGAGLPPFFAGLLPEGHRLTVLRRAVKTSPDDELSLLLAVGADVPGDVQVVPVGEVPLETPPLVPDDLRGADFRALTDAPDRHGIPGVQAKASATMLTVPVALARSRAILKVDPAGYPHLVVNEAAHLAAARRLRIPVAEHSVVRDGTGVQGLLVDRFDRVIGPGGDIERLALEDAAQVMGILPAAKYAVDSEAAVLALASAASASKIAARNLYLQLVFAWLVGNGDLHAKNLSILQAPDGRWSVAPVYDVACTAVYRDMTMALPVDGRTTRIRARHWAALADAIGLPERAALSANRLALEAAGAVRLDDLPFEGSVLHGAQRELRARRAQLED